MTQSIRKAYVDLAEGQVHYRTRAGQGTPVVFLHQIAGAGAMWEKVMARWPGAHPLYALDTPGFGGSFDPKGPIDIARYRGWISEAIDALNIPAFHLVGHHMGSVLAVGLAVDLPERVASLAMIGPSLLTREERAAFAQKLGAPFRPNRSGAYLLKTWEYLRVGGADQDIDLLHREMVDMLRAWASRPHAYGSVWASDSTPLFAAVACPALAICAHDDILFPYMGRLAELRPDIRQVILDSGANFEPDLAPDAVTAALAAHIRSVETAPPAGRAV
jgi:pimeloyl-ACP methyl ester carboxylesterase